MDGLGQKPDDTYITNKNTYDAFQNTDLESLLQRWGVDTVIVGGVVTFACCETTARCVLLHRTVAVHSSWICEMLASPCETQAHRVDLTRTLCRPVSILVNMHHHEAETAYTSSATKR